MLKRIYFLLRGGFKECAECNRFETCDRKPWIHRHEKDCNYGIINGK